MGNGMLVQLQPRDIRLLRGLFEARVMTLKHVSVLFFDGKHEMAKKRLQRLKTAGCVRERRRHISEPAALFLTAKSFRTLQELGELAMYPRITPQSFEKRSQVSELTLRHELEVMDVKVALTQGLASSATYSIQEFTTWPKLSEFKACRHSGEYAVVKPDAFIRVAELNGAETFEHSFFVELDRSTETLDTLWQRCQCYMDHYRSGGFAVRNGGTRDDFKSYPFRVLIVCKSIERVRNLTDTLADRNPPIRTMVWLTTRAQVESEPLGPIWVTPSVIKPQPLFT